MELRRPLPRTGGHSPPKYHEIVGYRAGHSWRGIRFPLIINLGSSQSEDATSKSCGPSFGPGSVIIP